ncbi:MAG: hypothetical protein M3Y08_16245 [Fibrobacterota bacterium]|nr:hypothetical protein [Fibrobacterota bacterium]
MRLRVFTVVFGILGLAAIHGMYMGGYSEPHYPAYSPIYMSWKDLRAAVKSEPAKAIGKRGKIFIRGIHLFINEPNKGIHIFDNGNPADPKPIAFINIPGNVDLAVKGDVLFADSFVDLVAIDIAALPAIKELNRQVDVFPYDAMQTADGEIWYYGETNKNLGVVIGWKKESK